MINSIEGLSSGLNLDFNDNVQKKDRNISFANILKEQIGKVNNVQKTADQVTQDFALGNIDSIHQVTIATEQAKLALDLTASIQNQVVGAYKEIMRMQI
ncbi:MAG: flagellar hook-basal body complex protein FliE [bacterium]